AGLKSSAEIVATTSDLTPAEQRRFAVTINSEAENLVPTIRNLIGYFDNTSTQDMRPISPMNEIDEAIITHNNHFPRLEDAADDLAKEIAPDRPVHESMIAALLDRRFGIESRLIAQNRDESGEKSEQVLLLPD